MSKNVNFSANQIRFIDWLACGKYDRSPPTQELFAQQIGVRPETLTRWKQGNHKYTEDEFKEAVIQRAREILGDDLPDIYNSLREEAKKGSFQHQKLVLELTGEFKEGIELSWREKLPNGYEANDVKQQFIDLMRYAAKHSND